jgi:DNA-binding transcriptional LysR family regulator
MDLRQLETFSWVVRLGGFRAAAERLNLSQPTVSARIRELESALGVRLFDRRRRAATLTPKGRELAEEAAGLLALHHRLVRQVADPQVVAGTVRLGVGELVALTWLPELLRRLKERHPALFVELLVDLTERLWSKLDHGEVDLALMPGPVRRTGVESRPLGTTPFAWMAAPALGLPDPVRPRDLELLPVLTLSRHSNLHELLEAWFRLGGGRLRRIGTCNSLHTIATLTMAGLGASFLPTLYYHREIAEGLLVPREADPPIPPLDYHAVYLRGGLEPMAEEIAALAARSSRFDPPGS